MLCDKPPLRFSFLPSVRCSRPSTAAANMTTIGKPTAAPEHQPPGHECCMCGDYGLTCELFRCRLCLFRSQHRYCSNVYPKAESYTVCNWCLLLDSSPDKARKSPNSSSPGKSGGGEDGGVAGKRSRRGDLIKRSPEPAGRKRVVSNGRLEEMMLIRRTKSEDIIVKNSKNNNGIVTKQVFRNKVRRYKLLDEVSS